MSAQHSTIINGVSANGFTLPEWNQLSDGAWVGVAIKDTGIGIAEEDQQIIFDAFRQVDGSTIRQYEGTGLGLAIAQRLIHMHDGLIWVESTIDVGTTFYILLPTKKIKLSFNKADLS